MNIEQIKADLKASLQTENYYAEAEFFRLLNDESIDHKDRVLRLSVQLAEITKTINSLRLLEAMLPPAPVAPPSEETPNV